MKKIRVSLIILLFFSFILNVNAGALRKNSIKTCPDGIKYGYYVSNGVSHWHVAEACDSFSGWCPNGDELSGDPCPQEVVVNTTKKAEVTTKHVETVTNGTTTKTTTTTSTSTTSTTSTTTTSKKVGISFLEINGYSFYTPIIDKKYEYITNNKKLKFDITLFNSDATYEIDGNLDELELDKEYNYTIKVVENDGTVVNYYFVVRREKSSSNAKLDSLTVNNSNVELDGFNLEYSLLWFENKIDFDYELSDSNANIIFYQNDKEISDIHNIKYDKNNCDFIIKIIDDSDNVLIYNLNITRLSFITSLLIVFFSCLVLISPIGILYLLYIKVIMPRIKKNKPEVNDNKKIVNNINEKNELKTSSNKVFKGITFPRIGMRKISPIKSIKNRTTGKIKRTIGKTLNPLYGMKGIGFLKNPKKSIKNIIYHKTTFSFKDLFK